MVVRGGWSKTWTFLEGDWHEGNVSIMGPRTHVAWRYEKSAPYISSPVVAGDYLYAVKNGGVMTCLNAKTGAAVWKERLPARGDYFASLVAADGKVYALGAMLFALLLLIRKRRR